MGKFVCEDLYYLVLKYFYEGFLKSKCIFVYVFILKVVNRDVVVGDFLKILLKIFL